MGTQLILNGLSGIAQTLLIQQPLVGGIFLLAVLIYSPYLALACLVSTLIANGVATLTKRDRSAIREGLYGYNGALLGLALTTFLPHGLMLWIYIGVTSALSVFLRDLFQRLRIPPFTMPYVFLAWLVLTFVEQNQGAASFTPVSGWTIPLIGMGQTIFLPSSISGLLILVGIACLSTRTLLLAFLGALIGCLPYFWLGDASYLTAGLISVNAALAAIGVLQVKPQLHPLFSVGFALFAALISPLLFGLLGAVSLPALTFPFIVTMWIGLGIISVVEKK